MKSIKLILFVSLLLITGKTFAQKPALTWKDVSKWTYNRGNSLSPDGQWMAWASGPTEGDLKMTIGKRLNQQFQENLLFLLIFVLFLVLPFVVFLF